MHNNLHGQTALITGASSGIGQAVARQMAARGCGVCLVGRNIGRLDALRNELQVLAPSQAYPGDIAEESEVRRLCADILRDHARVDLLIHCAGAISLGAIANAPVEDLDHQYRVNLRAPYLLTQLLLPQLKASRGQIVFVNSSVGTRVKENVGAYAATKHALKAIADTLRMEINSFGIRVLSVYPGNTATPMQQAIQQLTGRTIDVENLLTPADVADVILQALSLPRTAEVTDINIRPMGKQG